MTIRIGLAGLGYWGPNLARNFDELAELEWLCDADPARREKLASRYPGARVTADLDELLDDPALDAVVIATPVPTHYELAKRALEADKHVMVEKPPAMRASEMDELVELAEPREHPELGEVPGEVRAPVAEPDDADVDGACHRRTR